MMKAIVMGAGIMGVTTAYFLAKSGYQVTVLEKNSSSGLGCSYANGGQLSYSHIEPWAATSSLPIILKAALKPNSFLSFSNVTDKNFIKWGFNFLRNCGKNKTSENSRKLFLLGQESKAALADILSKEPQIKFNYNEGGILHFYQNPRIFEKAIKQAEIQQKLGIKLQIISRDECIKKEPTLVKLYDDKKLIGGIFYEDDASGNSLLFIKHLEKVCQEKYNVIFEYNTEIKNIFTNYTKITGINTSNGVFTADKYVYALGAYGNKLLNGIKIDPEIYPLKGHSLSISADDEEFIAPTMALTDVENKVVYSRIGNVFRAAGTIDINNLKAVKNISQINFLKSTIKTTFSDFGNVNQSLEWFGFRPFRANSIPLICEVKKYKNLYLNTGHGHLGWTLSFGSARILCDLINGKSDERFSFLQEELTKI